MFKYQFLYYWCLSTNFCTDLWTIFILYCTSTVWNQVIWASGKVWYSMQTFSYWLMWYRMVKRKKLKFGMVQKSLNFHTISPEFMNCYVACGDSQLKSQFSFISFWSQRHFIFNHFVVVWFDLIIRLSHEMSHDPWGCCHKETCKNSVSSWNDT